MFGRPYAANTASPAAPSPLHAPSSPSLAFSPPAPPRITQSPTPVGSIGQAPAASALGSASDMQQQGGMLGARPDSGGAPFGFDSLGGSFMQPQQQQMMFMQGVQGPQQQGAALRVPVLWLGDLDDNWTEELIFQMLGNSSEIHSIKIVRNKVTGKSMKYAFINCWSIPGAHALMAAYQGRLIPGTNKTFKLNWALRQRIFPAQSQAAVNAAAANLLARRISLVQPTHMVMGDPLAQLSTSPPAGSVGAIGSLPPSFQHGQQDPALLAWASGDEPLYAADQLQQGLPNNMFAPSQLLGPVGAKGGAQGGQTAGTPEDMAVFVGQLAVEVTGELLFSTFKMFFPSVTHARVVGGKGFGFVYFGNRMDRARALIDMQGYPLLNKFLTVNVARPPKPGTAATTPAASKLIMEDDDPNNTTVFVGGVDSTMTTDMLRTAFSRFGEILSVKLPIGRSYSFVQFAERAAAEECVRQLRGRAQIGAKQVRVSWGKPGATRRRSEDDALGEEGEHIAADGGCADSVMPRDKIPEESHSGGPSMELPTVTRVVKTS